MLTFSYCPIYFVMLLHEHHSINILRCVPKICLKHVSSCVSALFDPPYEKILFIYSEASPT